jgi:hypothetical protein
MTQILVLFLGIYAIDSPKQPLIFKIVGNSRNLGFWAVIVLVWELPKLTLKSLFDVWVAVILVYHVAQGCRNPRHLKSVQSVYTLWLFRGLITSKREYDRRGDNKSLPLLDRNGAFSTLTDHVTIPDAGGLGEFGTTTERHQILCTRQHVFVGDCARLFFGCQ